jgi:hypothetical protein
MVVWVISVIILVPLVAYWVNHKSESRVHKARLDAIQQRLAEIESEKPPANG